MKIIDATNGLGELMTEEETKNFLANDNNSLFVRIGFIDEKGEPIVIPLAYYFDSGQIYVTTPKVSKKVQILRKNNAIAYCIDDPTPPFRGVRGKGKVKILEDINQNISIGKKFALKNTGSLDNPMAKWLLVELEKGNNIILEITPTYYSTWKNTLSHILENIK